MAKKKQKDRPITVKSPKEGEELYFLFAGTIILGNFQRHSESLTKTYGTKWVYISSRSNGISGNLTNYPVYLGNVARTYQELKPKKNV